MATTYKHSAHSSPWPFSKRCKMLLWEWSWFFLCHWTPKPFNLWRVLILRLFGAKVHRTAFVHQRSRIEHPENISLSEKSCIGDRAHLYALDEISIGKDTVIAQESYLCTGDHDLSVSGKPLRTAPITIGDDCFIGLRAIILKDVTLGDRCIVGAGAVVAKPFPNDQILTGSPAKAHTR